MAGTGDPASVGPESARQGKHRYFACLADGSEPIAFTPPHPEPVPNPDARYFARALGAMEPLLGPRGLTFYLTWDFNELPSYGPDVVAIVLGDEAARVPGYFDRVAITFKGYGTRPPLGLRPAALPSRLGFATMLEFGEKLLIDLPGAMRVLRHALKNRSIGLSARPAIFPIPIGYFRQLDLPVTPILERPVDVFFAGSVQHLVGDDIPLARRVIPSAKVIARDEMIRALQIAQLRFPALRVDLRPYNGFEHADSLATEDYSRRLMSARICLAPRGASVETFRPLEGMRYGCIVVGDPLPRGRWFYDGAPVITVGRWRELPEILSQLLADEHELLARHSLTLAWWRDRCSEAALGAYMAEQINRCTVRSP